VHRRFATVLVLFVGSCADPGVVELRQLNPSVLDGGRRHPTETYLQGQSSVDLLFVVDNSAGMKPGQDALVSGIGTLLQRMISAHLDWRIGVVSTDLGIAPHGGPGCNTPGGDGARLQFTARTTGCTPPPDPYITATNVADPVAAFQCIAPLGTQGCGFERPFDAALKAVDPLQQPSINHGFSRDTALLVVLWVTDEDDCSAQDPALYDPDQVSLGPWTSHRCFAHDIQCSGTAPDGSLTGCASGKELYLRPVTEVASQLKALKPLGSVAAVAMVGPSTPVKVDATTQTLLPSCVGNGGIQATPAVRFQELVQGFGSSGVMLSICGADPGQQLASALAKLPTAAGPYCLRHTLRDPTRSGCIVEVTPPGKTKVAVSPSSDNAPGFRIVHPVYAGCSNGALVFDAEVTPAAGSEVSITCDFQS